VLFSCTLMHMACQISNHSGERTDVYHLVQGDWFDIGWSAISGLGYYFPK